MAIQPIHSGSQPAAWRLPQLLAVQVRHVRYPQPKLRFRGLDLVPFPEAVEILLTTSGPFPIQAYSPAIFIGDVPIIEYEAAGPNRYKFLAFDFRNLVEGAVISLGWPQIPEQKILSAFRYQVSGGLVA